jgi:hypothetical protein
MVVVRLAGLASYRTLGGAGVKLRAQAAIISACDGFVKV